MWKNQNQRNFSDQSEQKLTLSFANKNSKRKKGNCSKRGKTYLVPWNHPCKYKASLAHSLSAVIALLAIQSLQQEENPNAINLSAYRMSVIKTKVITMANHNWGKYHHKPMRIQSKNGREIASDQTRLVFVLSLIGWEGGVIFLNQSCSKTNVIPDYWRHSVLKPGLSLSLR